jgi:hypothetical protein
LVCTVASRTEAQPAPTPPPKVAEDAGGPAQKGKTEAVTKPDEAKKRPDGWSPGLALGGTFNLIDTRSVVGQQDGTAFMLGGALDAVLAFNGGIHEWRNALLASAGVARTPAIDEFIKTNDGLSFESIYLIHATEMFGPYARFAFNTQMFGGNDIRPGPVDYTVSNLDGTTTSYTGRRLGLTDPFAPFFLKESLGVFFQPLRETQIEMEGRVGFGAQEILAAGNLGVVDDSGTPQIEVKELDDSYQVGAEAVLNVWGFFDTTKRVSYTAGVGVLVPFVTSDLPAGDNRGLGELTNFEGTVGLNAKLFDWASLGYRFQILRQPMLVDKWQVSNRMLITLGGAWGSKAPEPEEPPPPCDCDKQPVPEAPAAPATAPATAPAASAAAEATSPPTPTSPGATPPLPPPPLAPTPPPEPTPAPAPPLP